MQIALLAMCSSAEGLYQFICWRCVCGCTGQVLQGKVRRAERLLQQRELRVAELQLRCRRLEKEKATRGKELVNKMPYYQHHQPQQQPQEPELEHKEQLEQPEQKPEPELKEEQQEQSVVNKLA